MRQGNNQIWFFPFTAPWRPGVKYYSPNSSKAPRDHSRGIIDLTDFSEALRMVNQFSEYRTFEIN